MGPKPVRGGLLNFPLEQPGRFLEDPTGSGGRRIRREIADLESIIPTASPVDHAETNGETVLSRVLFRAEGNACVLVEETRPVCFTGIARRLIDTEKHYIRFGLAIGGGLPKKIGDFADREHLESVLAAGFSHLHVEETVTQRFIDRDRPVFYLLFQRNREPFPVIKVPADQNDRFAARVVGVEHAGSGTDESAPNLRIRYRKCFNALDDQVGKVTVKLSNDRAAFGFRLFWKRLRDVCAYDPESIAENTVDEKC